MLERQHRHNFPIGVPVSGWWRNRARGIAPGAGLTHLGTCKIRRSRRYCRKPGCAENPSPIPERDLLPASPVASNSVHRSNPRHNPVVHGTGANGGGVFWARHTPNLAFGGVTSMALGSHRLAPKGLAKYRYPAAKTGSRGHTESYSHKSRLRGRDFPRLPIGRPYLKQAGRALAP